MTRKRRTFDKEFKLEAVKMVLEQGLSRAEVGRKLGVDYNSICNWVKSSQENQASTSGGTTTLSEDQKRIKELEKKLKHKEMEVEFLKKNGALLCERAKIKYRTILDWIGKYPLNFMCQTLGVSKSGYYKWLIASESASAVKRREIAEKIKESFIGSGKTYGSPRVHADLIKSGAKVSLSTVERLMKKLGLKSIIRKNWKRAKTNVDNNFFAANLLKRNFNPSVLDKSWVSDITYIWTKSGWVYLSTVIDLCSKKVVGWCLNRKMDASLVKDALTKALSTRFPVKDLTFHSDQGAQYKSNEVSKLLEVMNIRQSMSRRGNCWDNAVAESFFKTIKHEFIKHQSFEGVSDAKSKIFEWIETFYNRKRLHSSLGFLSPEEYELKIT